MLTRASGIDPAIVQAVRALLLTDGEWEDAGGGGRELCRASLAGERASGEGSRAQGDGNVLILLQFYHCLESD